MQRYKIVHRTNYLFSAPVRLDPHSLRLRPKEGHELRIETATLTIAPVSQLSWHRDVEDNCVAIATFASPTDRLTIDSEVIIHQYNEAPLDFIVDEYAVNYPFTYQPEDREVLAPYLDVAGQPHDRLDDWLGTVWQAGEAIQSYSLLQRLCTHIHQTLDYQIREAPGVQIAEETLSRGQGSCRDFACLFMAAARRLGLAARFVSGYLHVPPSEQHYGATHAWAEVYLPGAGWKGFDPTNGEMAGSKHIAVAVARSPQAVPPVAGSYIGNAEATLSVGVWVSEL